MKICRTSGEHIKHIEKHRTIWKNKKNLNVQKIRTYIETYRRITETITRYKNIWKHIE